MANPIDVRDDEDEVCYAPESGQPIGGRDNPWDHEADEAAGTHHAFPAEHHEPPGDDL